MNTIQDGIKNYYSVLYYVAFDEGNHFSGMHYPFGDHIIFSDNMPLFSLLIKYGNKILPGLDQYTLGFLHFLLLVSFPLAVHYLYLILRRFKVGIIFSIVSALFIAFFSPQIIKIFAHYGMALVFYIPAIIYYVIRYTDSRRKKYLAYIFVIGTIVSAIHLYNGAIIAILLGFAGISNLILKQNQLFKQRLRFTLTLWLLGSATLLPISIYLKATDKLTDRPTYPYATLANETTFNDLLVNDVPLGHIFQFAFGKATVVAGSEGKSYIGVVSILVLLTLGIRTIKRLISPKKSFVSQQDPGLNIWLLTALFQLLFAMAVPFIIDRDFFADQISALRNFRTLGRFAWPFYYIIMLYCSIFIYKEYKRLKQVRKLYQAYILIGGCVLLWVIQLSGPLKFMRDFSAKAPGNYARLYDKGATNWQEWLAQHNLKAGDFQALLGLPFYHSNASEKIWIMDVNEDFNQFEFCKLSLQTSLPMFNSMLARSSWSQSFELVQIIDGKLNPKTILNKINNKPIIILLDKNTPLKDKEKEWLEYARFIGDRDKNYAVYTIDPQTIKNSDAAYRDSLKTLATTLNEPFGLLGNGENTFWYLNNFSTLNDDTGFADKGIFIPKSAQEDDVDTIKVPRYAVGNDYLISIWVKCNMYDYRTPYFEIYQYDSLGKETAFNDFNTKYSTNIIDDWFLAEKLFTIHDHTNFIVFKAISGSKKIIYKGLDNLLIQPRHRIHFYKSPLRGLLLSNRPQ